MGMHLVLCFTEIYLNSIRIFYAIRQRIPFIQPYTLLKFCLFSMGAIWGMTIPKKAHKPATCIATSVFVVTYIPLMFKLCKIVKNDCLKEI